MTARWNDRFHVEWEKQMAARGSARVKTAELLGAKLSELSDRALLRRQRAARKVIAEALGATHGASSASEIAFHLSEWFEEAAFIVALQLDPKRFSKAEIEAGVSDVLANVLDHMWEAVLAAGGPLPCLPDEKLERDDDDDS